MKRYQFRDWQLSKGGRWERWLTSSRERSESGIFDGVHLMIGMPREKGGEESFHPEFWGSLVPLGEIVWSIFEKEVFWNIADPKQAMRRVDTMVEFVVKNHIEKPEPPRKPRIGGTIWVDGKAFSLREEDDKRK